MLEVNQRIVTRKMLHEWLAYEKSKYNVRGINLILAVSENAILCRHQILLRKTEYYTNTNRRIIKTIFKFLLLKTQNKYMLHIPVNCCERGLRIMHVGPVLINDNASVGKDCVFHINTALVANGTTDKAPILGNGVVMGIGSIALGGINIADNTAIGANAVVCKDIIISDTTMAGVPARMINSKGRSAWNKNTKQ